MHVTPTTLLINFTNSYKINNYSPQVTFHTIILENETKSTMKPNFTDYLHTAPGAKKDVDLKYINFVIATLTILVNSFVVFLFCKKRTLLNTPSHRLLLSLAICDFLTGVTVVCHIVIMSQCKTCIPLRVTVEILTTFLVETVITHLCGITLDRFLSLFYALRYRDIVTRKKSLHYIVLAWLLPFFASIIQMSWLYKVVDGKGSEEDYKLIADIEPWFSMISFLLFFAIPMLLLGFAFSAMFLEIRRLLLKTPNRRNRDVSGISFKQRRVVYIFGCMYICFFIFSLPFFLLRILLDLTHWTDMYIDRKKIYLANDFAYMFKSMTSLTNPIIYTAINREFRSIIGQILKDTRRRFSKFPFRKLSSQTSFLNVSMRRRSMPISSINDASIHDSGIYEICMGDGEHCMNSLMPKNMDLRGSEMFKIHFADDLKYR